MRFLMTWLVLAMAMGSGLVSRPGFAAEANAVFHRPEANSVALVIDTSGSMRMPADDTMKPAVLAAIRGVLDANPQFVRMLVVDSDGRPLLTTDLGWLPLEPTRTSEATLSALRKPELASHAYLIPGTVRAMGNLGIAGFPDARLTVFMFGDELTLDEEIVLMRLDHANPVLADGRRAVSISIVLAPPPDLPRRAKAKVRQEHIKAITRTVKTAEAIARLHGGRVVRIK